MSQYLERVVGPACPRCGCEDSRVLDRAKWWGRVNCSRRCAACGHQFSAPEVEHATAGVEMPEAEEPQESASVTFHVIRCPHCGGEKTRVTKTMRPVRYHRCRGCGQNFKSVEKLK